MSFLKAEWRRLAIANYEVNESDLIKHLPYGTELDTWDGKHYVSLVGFMFVNTKMLGMKIPFHVNFEEVNLRFYVRYNDKGKWKRGVVFIKELVPRRALSIVANTLYSEHYQTVKMSHEWIDNHTNMITKYEWEHNNDQHHISLTSEKEAKPIPTGSEEEFITEHYWGYTKVNESKTYEYEVTHPKWDCYKVLDHDIRIDFGSLYGAEFSELTNRKPDSVMLAEGSLITVENKRTLR